MEEIKLPQLGQSVEEAAIVTWFKNEGDTVANGDPLFSVQTDKAEIECESTASGVLRKILVEPDIEVPVMTVVALVGEADEALPDLSAYALEDAAPAEAEAEEAPAPAAEPTQEVPTATPSAPAAPAGKKGVSPRARKRAGELKVYPELAAGTGASGRVMEADVEALAAKLESVRITPTARNIALEKGLDITRITGTGPGGKITKDDVEEAAKTGAAAALPSSGEVRRVPLSPMRKIIAQRMGESKYSAPHYYVTVEVDMANAVTYRRGLKEFKVSYNDLVLYATAQAIQQFPAVNARWAGDAIEELGDINLGFAVALPTGLVVPVIKHIQTLTLEGIHNEARALADKARSGKLVPDDYSGNTFTISNLGAFGVDQFTAIINQPDSAILAVGQMKERPVVIDGGIHIRPIMKMTLSSDHRVIDGAVAAQFMGALREILEAAEF